MFNDVKNKDQAIASEENKPKPVEDIFSETENSNSQEALTENLDSNTTMPEYYQPSNIYESGKSGRNKKRILKLILILIVITIIGVGGYLVYSMYLTSQMNKEMVESELTTSKDEENSQSNDKSNDITIISEKIIDSDNDGLSDEEEASFGTDLLNPDTDGDGLFDREEIKIYKTDPLNPDTDGDGFLDGNEVKAGYNPLGPGRRPENFDSMD